MSGGSSANNSWTILTSEETVAETLRPLAEGTEQNEESQTSAAGSGEDIQPANAAEPPEGLPVQDYTASEEKPAELSEASVPSAVTETPIPSTLEASGGDEAGQTEGSPEGPAELSPDPDSSSDSYTCITASPDEPPASLLSAETVGSAELAPDEEKEALRHLNGEELHLEGEESEQLRSSDLGKQADSPPDSEAAEERAGKAGEEGEPEVRRRRSLLAALERVGRREEEEEDEEFQVPQREEDSGFSVNKCILGAVILLGLGTIFFSESDYGPTELKGAEVPGKREWLNPEAPPPPVDGDSSQLLNKLAEGSQQISVLQAQLQAQKEELKAAEGHAAEGAKERRRWEEVEKENSRLKTEMASLPVLQKENERMKRDLESVPALQKELETLRSTVTELKLSSAADQAAHVKPATSPPAGQSEDGKQARKPWQDQKEKKKRDKHDMGEKKDWKEKPADKKERKDGGKKEWKKEKHEQVMFEKEGKRKRQNDETKQPKREKTSRGDEGKPWKNREGKKEWTGKGEKKEWKEEKEWKKVKNEKVHEGKPWKGGKEEGKKVKDGFKESGREKWEKKEWKEKGEKKEWKEKGERKEWKEKGEKKEWKDKGEKKEWKEKGERKEWKEKGEKKEKGERKDWKKESEWKDKGERKEWKEKGEKKEWKKENEWKDKTGDKGKGERKHWEGSKNQGKERSGKDERKHEWSKNGKSDKEWKGKDEEEWKGGRQKERKHNGDGKKDKSEKSGKFTGNHAHKEEHLYGDRKPPHTHRKPSLDQPEYWQRQKDRLQHNPKPPQQCGSLETCAQSENLLPVPLPEFEAILRAYLAKAEEAGVDESKREELRKLAAEFFKDGVFAHDQMSFQDFVEDVADILEDMVEGDEEEDSAIEEEMEAFEREVMEKFSIPGVVEKEERIKGSERGRG